MSYEQYAKQIRISDDSLEWIKAHKGKKSAAGFLEEIIKQARENDQIRQKTYQS